MNNPNFPQWTTEITDTTVMGEDQLGIEGAAQSYQQEILPGIITVTNHARYYSFMPGFCRDSFLTKIPAG